MKRNIALLFVCLCMQFSAAQTLPNWFAIPHEGEYVGCSFPSEFTSARHETAIVGAILNYIICNKDFNTIVKEDMSSRSDDETFKASSKRLFILPIHVQLVRLEAIGKNTYVAIKVDTIENKKELNYLSFDYRLNMHETDRYRQEASKIELKFGKEGKYQLMLQSSDSETSLSLLGEKSYITEDISGGTVENCNNTVIKDDNRIVAIRIPSYDRYGSPDKNIGNGLVFWQALMMELKQKVLNTEYIVEGDDRSPAQHFKNTKNEMVEGKLYVIYQPVKK